MKKISRGLAFGALTTALLAGTSAAQERATLEPQDYLDIRGLIDRYAHILDNCVTNGYRYADMFTADGTFGVSSKWGGGAKIWFRDRDQLAAAGGGRERCRPQSDKPSYHLTINPVITPTADGAQAISTLLTITNDTNDRGDVVHWEGGYEDTFEKTAAGWRFKSRFTCGRKSHGPTDRRPQRNLANE